MDPGESILCGNRRELAVVGAWVAASAQVTIYLAHVPDDAVIGVPFRWAFIAPQQRERQWQMALNRLSIASFKKVQGRRSALHL